ncbi:MAG: hypothetical protein BWX86_01955 [Verrucomicrobia bacterium ADurb.Bin122]|nr:MAG: hypothetical protein BWX86_01955 [Verrucomicrobia bacterium ADurb.Bin122]
MQFVDLFRERLADAANLFEFTSLDQPLELGILHGFHDTGPCGVRPDLERVLPLQFQQRGDLPEDIRDLVFRHA